MLDSYFINPTEYIQYDHKRTTNPPEYLIQPHKHIKYEIYYFISGDAQFCINKKNYRLQQGDLFIINSSDEHSLVLLSEKTYERMQLHFCPSLVREFCSSQMDLLAPFNNKLTGFYPHLSLSEEEKIEISKYLHSLESLAHNLSNSFPILYLIRFLELLVYINSIYNKQPTEQNNNGIPIRLKQIIDYIEKNIKEEITLEQLSNEFFLSPSYLSRCFKNDVGMTISDYILHRRVKIAQQQLMLGFSVDDACYNSGFKSYHHFIRTFKRLSGVTPLEYRKNHQKS